MDNQVLLEVLAQHPKRDTSRLRGKLFTFPCMPRPLYASSMHAPSAALEGRDEFNMLCCSVLDGQLTVSFRSSTSKSHVILPKVSTDFRGALRSATSRSYALHHAGWCAND
jgi:hypothetical protein